MGTPREDYSRFCCPNPECKFYNRSNGDNIAHRSWGGKNGSIERLCCKVCKKEFSSRAGTLLENSKISLTQQETLLKCFRWGMCDEGSADIGGVNVKTVRLFREKVAKRAEIHHDNCVRDVPVKAVQCDELLGKVHGGKTWVGCAITMQTFLILAVYVGARNRRLADTLLANIWVRCCGIAMVLTDGWKTYLGAVVRCFADLYRPRRARRAGRLRAKCFKFRGCFFYGQVVKATNAGFSLVQVKSRSFFQKLSDCELFIRAYGLGNKIHTIHIERWFGTLRANLASLRRKSRCGTKGALGIKDRVWVFASLYNWVIPHKTLSKKQPTTPAMAAGLTNAPLSYRDYILKPIFQETEVHQAIERKISAMNSKESLMAFRRFKSKKEERVMWTAPPRKTREAA
jgi:IS1 family transposase